MKKLKYLGFFVVIFFVNHVIVGQTHYYLRTSGTPANITSWTQDPTGATILNPPANFGLSNAVWHFANRITVTALGGVMGTDTSSANQSTVIIEPGFHLNFVGGAQRVCTRKLQISNTGSLTMQTLASQTTFTFNNLDINSTVIYNATTGAPRPIKQTNYGNLVIAQSCSLSSNIVVGSLFVNAARTLSLSGNSLVLNGTNQLLNGTGTITGDLSSTMEFYNGSASGNGTLNLASGSNTLDLVIIQLSSDNYNFSLGSDLYINTTSAGGYYQFIGSVNLNGFDLHFDSSSDVFFPGVVTDGYIIGNSNSGIFINGNISGPTLFMDPSNNTLGVLSLNNPFSILDISNSLNIVDSLSIQGGATINTNNFLTLASSLNNKGRLGNMNNGTLSGDLRVQTFARGGTTDWVNIGVSGVTGETIQNGWYGQIPMAIAGSTTDVTSAGGYYFESVQRWEEQTGLYDTSVTVFDALIPGEGYWVFLGTGLTTTSDMAWTVSGPAVTGPQVINLTNTTPAPTQTPAPVNAPGWNLIANPFPSPIDWASVLANNSSAPIYNAYYIYDPDLGNTVSFVGGVASPGSGPLTNYQTMADVIPMGQAFYVYASANTSITISEGDKSSSNTANFQLLKTNQAANIGSPIRLNIDGSGYHDDAVIRFHSNATTNFDKALDAYKMYTSPGYVGYPGQWSLRTAIATQSNNEDFSINSIPYAQTQNAVIPVVARVYQSGTHTISASELQNLPPGTCVDLKDLYTNTVYDLTSGPCIVNMSDTTFYPRFELTVCANVIASVKNNTVKNAPAIAISKDAVGIYSDFNFAEQSDAKITITNILGQKIVADKKVSVKNERVYIDANLNDNLIFVTVETANERITRKFINIK